MHATLVRCTAIIADRLLDAGIPAPEVSEFVMKSLTALRIEVVDGDYDGYVIAAPDFDRLVERTATQYALPSVEALR